MATNYREHPTPNEIAAIAADWAAELADVAAMEERHRFELEAARRKQMATWRKLQQALRVETCTCDECRGLVPKPTTEEG